MNSDFYLLATHFYLLATHFFKYTFQQILNPILYFI